MSSDDPNEAAAEIERLRCALEEADKAMEHAQWGTSHPARMAIWKTLHDPMSDASERQWWLLWSSRHIEEAQMHRSLGNLPRTLLGYLLKSFEKDLADVMASKSASPARVEELQRRTEVVREMYQRRGESL